MSRILLLIACSFTVASLSAQRTPDDLVALFFEDFKKDKGRAIEKIYQTSPWMARANDAIANLKGEVEKLTPEYVGNMHGFSLICRKQLADCFVLQSYLLRYDRQPIRFTLSFTNPTRNGSYSPFLSMLHWTMKLKKPLRFTTFRSTSELI